MMDPRPIYLHYLQRLANMLMKAQQDRDDPDALVSQRLHPDMLPFASQVRAACSFSLRGCCPLAGQSLLDFSTGQQTLTALLRQVEETRAYIQTLPAFDCDEARLLHEKAGFAEVNKPAAEFIYQYNLPNFFFHLSMVYAIARAAGVPLSKQDFDDYHRYPQGFSFEQEPA